MGGGGLQNGGGTYAVKNSLIWGPTTSGSAAQLELHRVVRDARGSVVGDSLDLTCSGFFSFLNGDLEVLAMDLAGIGPLSANGGPTLTVPLLPGSPAIDHASGCPPTDQRGVSRPQGAGCDSGAF